MKCYNSTADFFAEMNNFHFDTKPNTSNLFLAISLKRNDEFVLSVNILHNLNTVLVSEGIGFQHPCCKVTQGPGIPDFSVKRNDHKEIYLTELLPSQHNNPTVLQSYAHVVPQAKQNNYLQSPGSSTAQQPSSIQFRNFKYDGFRNMTYLGYGRSGKHSDVISGLRYSPKSRHFIEVRVSFTRTNILKDIYQN
ncbi:11537_t:CDS:2, partial [Ambispora gerdemannii]